MQTNALEQRRRFVRDYESGQWLLAELCDRFGITRPTAYKWLARYEELGEEGLEELSRAPHRCPHRVERSLEQKILAMRKRERKCGRKLRRMLETRHPGMAWPAVSTINAILDRHGMLHKRRPRRPKPPHPGTIPLETERPNQVWPADFKGQFRTGDGQYVYPLTITDHHSRRLLVCVALPSTRLAGVKPAFVRLFREVGLPEALRTDNGPPFASQGLLGFSELSVWCLQLGIAHQRIRPGCPQDNPTHERMHRELKKETTRPPAPHLRAQQRKFDRFQKRYNTDWPHDGIGGAVPDALWQPSPRPYPERIPPPEYPAHWEKRKVSIGGTFRLKGPQVFLSHALAKQVIGLEEVDDGIWNIIYYTTVLGRVDQRTGQITGAQMV